MKGKRFAYERKLFQKAVTHKLCQNAYSKNGCPAIQMGTLRVLFNILSIPLLSRVHNMSGYSKIQKKVVLSFYISKKVKKMQVGS